MQTASQFGADPNRLVAIAAFLGVCALVASPPIEWLPPTGEAASVLGSLLAAQAAIAALSLAVVLFALERVSARPDADDRIFEEYVRRSHMWSIFLAGLGAVAVTGLVLLAGEFASRGVPIAEATPGLQNLVLAAAVAFFASVVLPAALLERASSLARPGAWRDLRREVNEQRVREAVQAFLSSRQQVRTVNLGGEEGEALFEVRRDPGDGAAADAIESILDDAHRAMEDRRNADFAAALASIADLVEYAMDEIEPSGFRWRSPGAQPEWPPLRALSRNLTPFREEVIRRASQENLDALWQLDYRLLSDGILRRCGEEFTVGLDGYLQNYQIASRLGNSELRERFRDGAWRDARHLLSDTNAEELFPYSRHVVGHVERLLSDAIGGGREADYAPFNRAFRSLLASIRRGWNVGGWPRTRADELYDVLEQQYGIAVMGLAGRAALLAESGAIPDMRPFLDVARVEYDRVDRLADDLAGALVDEDRRGFSIWSEWEMEGVPSGEARSIRPDRYPLTFFSVRLLELAVDSTALDLHGQASRVFRWFTENVDAVGRHAQLGPEASLQVQREFALEALSAAVERDTVAADEEIIERGLSDDRVAAFKSDLYGSVFSANTVEQLFDGASSAEYLSDDSGAAPEIRGASELIGKGFLAVQPERARMHYGTLDGEGWGTSTEDDVVQRLCEELDRSPVTTTSLDSTEDLPRAIDIALAELGSPERVMVVLGGDSHSIARDTGMPPLDGFEPWWELPDPLTGEVARYRSHPIIEGPNDGERRFYVVDLRAWGCFVRAQVEGATDLLVEVDLITGERAQELLAANPNLLTDEPDQTSKLRKLQTFVELRVAGRTGFRVRDASRARKVVAPPPAG